MDLVNIMCVWKRIISSNNSFSSLCLLFFSRTSVIKFCCLPIMYVGASLTKYLEHVEEIRRSKLHYSYVLFTSTIHVHVHVHLCVCIVNNGCTLDFPGHCHFHTDYRYRKDEIFKRLKATTFAQLVSQYNVMGVRMYSTFIIRDRALIVVHIDTGVHVHVNNSSL